MAKADVKGDAPLSTRAAKRPPMWSFFAISGGFLFIWFVLFALFILER